MRVLYLHAGKAKPNKTEIQSNEHYSRLIQQELQLTLNNDGSNQSIYSLPRGQILGLAIFDKTFWYNKAKHSQDPWATGPFCYAIKDIFRLDTGVVALGNQSIWTPAESIHQTIMKQESAKRKLKEWKTQYKNKLYIGANGIPSALTIKQPMVYGILERKKKIKNRKKSKFRLHPNKALYNPPSKPDRITCRWCPTDGSLCTNSYHISETKNKNTKRKTAKKRKTNSNNRNNKRKGKRQYWDIKYAELLESDSDDLYVFRTEKTERMYFTP
eukprot:528813_1